MRLSARAWVVLGAALGILIVVATDQVVPAILAGAEGIRARARALGLAAPWIRGDGEMEMTPAARPRTAWLAGEA